MESQGTAPSPSTIQRILRILAWPFVAPFKAFWLICRWLLARYHQLEDYLGVGLTEKPSDTPMTQGDVEAMLIEREIRPWKAWQNFLSSLKIDRDDTRRNAALRALLSSIFSVRTAAIAGGTLIGIATLWFMWEQNRLIRDQNTAILDQIKQQQTQIDQERKRSDLQRRTELVATLWASVVDQEGFVQPLQNIRSRQEAFHEFFALETQAHQETGRNIDLSSAQLSGLRFVRIDFSKISMKGANLDHANFENCTFGERVLDNVQARFVSFQHCTFAGPPIVNAYFRNAFISTKGHNPYFSRCDLSEASFFVGNDRGLRFDDCDVRGLNFGRFWNGQQSTASHCRVEAGVSTNPMMRYVDCRECSDAEWSDYMKNWRQR